MESLFSSFDSLVGVTSFVELSSGKINATIQSGLCVSILFITFKLLTHLKSSGRSGRGLCNHFFRFFNYKYIFSGVIRWLEEHCAPQSMHQRLSSILQHLFTRPERSPATVVAASSVDVSSTSAANESSTSWLDSVFGCIHFHIAYINLALLKLPACVFHIHPAGLEWFCLS